MKLEKMPANEKVENHLNRFSKKQELANKSKEKCGMRKRLPSAIFDKRKYKAISAKVFN